MITGSFQFCILKHAEGYNRFILKIMLHPLYLTLIWQKTANYKWPITTFVETERGLVRHRWRAVSVTQTYSETAQTIIKSDKRGLKAFMFKSCVIREIALIEKHSQHNELNKAVTLDVHPWGTSEREMWEWLVEILQLIMKERV